MMCHIVAGCVVWTLQHIPMPVLYGVFLYMGITSLRGIQVSTLHCCNVYSAWPTPKDMNTNQRLFEVRSSLLVLLLWFPRTVSILCTINYNIQ